MVSDNQGVVSIVNNGSMNTELQDLAFSVFKISIRHSITLEMEWSPRSLNDRADYLSRIVDKDDWGLSLETFFQLQNTFGQIDIDWFASKHNAKVARFYSRFWNSSCLGVDAFTVSWSKDFGLFVPPVYLLNRVLGENGSSLKAISLELGKGSSSFLNSLGTINITVIESSKDIETGEVIAICCSLSFPPKMYPASTENPLLEPSLKSLVGSFTEVNKLASYSRTSKSSYAFTKVYEYTSISF